MSSGLCEDCFKGVQHEGTPTGKIIKIDGVDSYVAIPEGDYPKDKVILYFPDVFGIQYVNSQLICDNFAANGFKVVAPDYFYGDFWASDIETQPGFDVGKHIGSWFPKHTPAQTRPIIDKVVAALQAEGVKEFGITGYCFGGRYAFDLAYDGISKVSVVSHPSLLQKTDFEERYPATKVPLLINWTANDGHLIGLLPKDVSEATAKEPAPAGDDLDATSVKIREYFHKSLGAFSPGFKEVWYKGCVHGFATRGDEKNEEIRQGKAKAFEEAVKWFQKYL